MLQSMDVLVSPAFRQIGEQGEEVKAGMNDRGT